MMRSVAGGRHVPARTSPRTSAATWPMISHTRLLSMGLRVRDEPQKIVSGK